MSLRLRKLLPLLIAMLVVPFGCEKPGAKTEKAKGDEGKPKGDDDEEPKGKPKKSDPKPVGGDDEAKPKDDEPPPAASVDAGVDAGPSAPKPCAPALVGPLGPKPKYLTSAGHTRATVALWSAGDDGSRGLAVTIAADGKCYVHYVKVQMEREDLAATLHETKLSGWALAIKGTDDKGNDYVGFRVAYSSSFHKGAIDRTQTHALYVGYQQNGSVPYSCTPIVGEAGSDRCAMYQVPLHVFEKETCGLVGKPAAAPSAKASAPPHPLASMMPSVTPSGVTIPKTKLGPAIQIKNPMPLPSLRPLPSASSVAGAEVCTDACENRSTLANDGKHVFVRVSAGAGTARCPATRQSVAASLGDSWLFETNHWVRR